MGAVVVRLPSRMIMVGPLKSLNLGSVYLPLPPFLGELEIKLIARMGRFLSCREWRHLQLPHSKGSGQRRCSFRVVSCLTTHTHTHTTCTNILRRTWFNKIGNREMYMNCAQVTITGGGSGLGIEYPQTFVAQIGTNECTVPEGIAVEFPHPGAVVQRGDGNKSAPPKGMDCV